MLAKTHDKPLLAAVEAGVGYEPYVRRMREAGLPVLRAGDEAIRALGRYLCHRCSIHVAGEERGGAKKRGDLDYRLHTADHG